MLATTAPAMAAATTTTMTYGYSSGYQTFTVPDGTSTLYIDVDGGSGANGQGDHGGGEGEPGGQVMGDLAVTPGEVLTLWVGGAGQDDGGQGFGSPTHDDFEGGAGGQSVGAAVGAGNGGGGGAASYLEVNGHVVALAGGGGGGGGSGTLVVYPGSAGSPGGYNNVDDPVNPDSYAATYSPDPALYASGASGAGGSVANGSDNGGAGTAAGSNFGGGGGGGGGGYAICDGDPGVYCWSAGGGGGGGNTGGGGGGGAGGNSYADPSMTGTTFATSGLSAGSAGEIFLQFGQVSSTDVTNATGPVDAGQPVTFDAFVSPTDGGGSVTFSDGQTTIPGCADQPFISGGGNDWEAVCTTSALPVGSTAVTAAYSGDTAYTGSSASVAADVNQDPTTTSLTAAPTDPEAEAPTTLTAHVNHGDGGGSVAFTVGGNVLSGCGDVPVAASTAGYQASCVASWSTLGSYAVKATYSGDTDTAGSTGSTDVTVTPWPATTTALSLSSSGTVYGSEQHETISVTVASPGGTPSGTVYVNSNVDTVCAITLHDGAGSCALSGTQLPIGTETLTASYSGVTGFYPSVSPAVALVVSKAPSTTALSLSSSKATYGDEQTDKVSVVVTSPSGPPNGTVTVKSGSTAVCTITLGSGKGGCTLSATALAAATQQLTASYNGSTDLASSRSSAVTLDVSKALSRTTLTLSASRVTYGREQAERLSVRVAPQYSGTPGGTVAVTSGSTTLCVIRLASGAGSCTLSATKLPAGTRTWVARYSGSSDFTRSASVGKALAVVK
jgi:hypothetical protein